jgi:hypothetical protein
LALRASTRILYRVAASATHCNRSDVPILVFASTATRWTSRGIALDRMSFPFPNPIVYCSSVQLAFFNLICLRHR